MAHAAFNEVGSLVNHTNLRNTDTRPDDLTQEHDNLLLGSPWIGKKDQHGKTHLIKYASSSDGQSLVFLTTNLETIHYQNPSPQDIPAVPWEVDHPFLLTTQDFVRDTLPDEPGDQIAGLVQQISLMMGERWDEVQLLIEVENKEPVAYLRMDDFAWRFVLTELPSSQALPLLNRHLLHPLMILLATDRSIPVPSLSTAESSARLISDPEIMRAIKRVTTKPKASQEPASSSDAIGSPTPRKKAVPRSRRKSSTPVPSSSSVPPSSMPPSSPPKMSSRQATSSIPPLTGSSPPPAMPETTLSKRKPNQILDKSSSPSVGSAMDFKPPTQVPPQTSQKSKREREKEEEEEMEKRMNEMRKRMEKGAGGKLGKRRLAR
ncbi:uncharacterized protein IL334_002212 [Kwoniella shivajii]|uniref:Uncharacterized protein n=1 Tax=Kwoniella shivajii TaxID=564305 RepID=A0ABZ1CVR7_9TREE|nr:hypothetical protein IL334_002212 [Kwoniella shivajii]